jgi:hypothetical protein
MGLASAARELGEKINAAQLSSKANADDEEGNEGKSFMGEKAKETPHIGTFLPHFEGKPVADRGIVSMDRPSPLVAKPLGREKQGFQEKTSFSRRSLRGERRPFTAIACQGKQSFQSGDRVPKAVPLGMLGAFRFGALRLLKVLSPSKESLSKRRAARAIANFGNEKENRVRGRLLRRVTRKTNLNKCADNSQQLSGLPSMPQQLYVRIIT